MIGIHVENKGTKNIGILLTRVFGWVQGRHRTQQYVQVALRSQAFTVACSQPLALPAVSISPRTTAWAGRPGGQLIMIWPASCLGPPHESEKNEVSVDVSFLRFLYGSWMLGKFPILFLRSFPTNQRDLQCPFHRITYSCIFPTSVW
jgi:hypothetical protein